VRARYSFSAEQSWEVFRYHIREEQAPAAVAAAVALQSRRHERLRDRIHAKAHRDDGGCGTDPLARNPLAPRHREIASGRQRDSQFQASTNTKSIVPRGRSAALPKWTKRHAEEASRHCTYLSVQDVVLVVAESYVLGNEALTPWRIQSWPARLSMPASVA
jgi:hypothetical protein